MSSAAAAIAAQVGARLPATPLVVALSGGADSAVLAWAATQCTDQIRAVSVDHGLPASGDLMRAAAAIAAMLGMEHDVVTAGPTPASETALREARYAALQAAVTDGELVLTGHTLDDQAETVLGNILRGSGAAGLAGIPSSRGRFRRPMLGIARSATRDVAEALGLPFVDDPQNADLAVRRNRIRHQAIPLLADLFNPKLVEALGRLASSAGGDDALIEARAARIPVTHRDGAVIVPAAALATLPVAVAARVARRALRLARGPHPGSSYEIAAVLGAVDGDSVTIGGGVDVRREGPWVVLVVANNAIPAATAVDIGSEAEFGDWIVSASIGTGGIGRFTAAIARPQQLVVRTGRSDERIAISGGSKRIGDAMAEAGIPRRVRPVWPIVEADGTIAWIAGARVAPAAADTPMITLRARRNS